MNQGKINYIAHWLIEEAKKTECYKEQMALCDCAVVGFDWEEVEFIFSRLDSEEKAEILYRLESRHNVFVVENGGNEPDFDIHFEN